MENPQGHYSKPYKCNVIACKDLRFSSREILLRHEREAHGMHGMDDRPFQCPYEGCERGAPGNGFPRHWAFRDHMKRVHNDSAPGQHPRYVDKMGETITKSDFEVYRSTPYTTPDAHRSFNPKDTADLKALEDALQRGPVSSTSEASDMAAQGQQGKGILRTPRDKFPEDPTPIREGVAPLKDSKKAGIPPDPRWTKIDRRLVNPEALEAGKERFETREDFVIVLRVLSRDEVQYYADVTKRIREARGEYENEEEQDRRRERDDARHELAKSTSNVGRVWPGMHQQAALAKAQAQQRESKRLRGSQATDPIVEEDVSQLLNSIRHSNVSRTTLISPDRPLGLDSDDFVAEVLGNEAESTVGLENTFRRGRSRGNRGEDLDGYPDQSLGDYFVSRPPSYATENRILNAITLPNGERVWADIDYDESNDTRKAGASTRTESEEVPDAAEGSSKNSQFQDVTSDEGDSDNSGDALRRNAQTYRSRSNSPHRKRHLEEGDSARAAALANNRSRIEDAAGYRGRKDLRLGGKEFFALPDTGSDRNTITEEFAREHGLTIAKGADLGPNERSRYREGYETRRSRSRSRASSIASIADSIFSFVSGSSMSSVAGPQTAVDRLVALLLDDSTVKTLCTDALATVERERFERNLRRLLKEFAIGLRREAGTVQQRQAAHFVRVRARNSAYMICSKIGSKKKSSKPEDIPFEHMSEESEEDDSDEEVDDLQELEAFIKTSEALNTLRDKLKEFVYPRHEMGRGDLKHNEQEIRKSTPPLGNVKNPSPDSETEKATISETDFTSNAKTIYHSSESKLAQDFRTTGTNNQMITDYEYGEYSYTEPRELAVYDLNNDVGRLVCHRRHSFDSSILPIRDVGMAKDDFDICYSKPLRIMAKTIDFGRKLEDSFVSRRDLYDTSNGEAIILEMTTKGTPTMLRSKPKPQSWIIESFNYTLGKVGAALGKPTAGPRKGWTRMEYQCKCGRIITDDVKELRAGAANRLQERLSCSSKTYDSSQASTMGNSNRRFVTLIQSIRSSLGIYTRKNPESPLPMHELRSPNVPAESGNSQPQLPATIQIDLIYLLICYNKGKYEERLLQLDLTKLAGETDRELFQILRQSYYDLKTGLARFLSLRSLHSIQFVQFEMYKSELVDIKRKDTLPPPEDVDYRYAPAPPETIPPIGTNYLMHIFHHPDCAEDEPLCLSRFPKKLKEKLLCKGGIKPGWGLQFIEGWDGKKLWLVGFLFFGLGSLTIGVLWAVLEKSIQDAFAIAAYVVAFGTMSVGTIQALLVV